MERSKKMCRSRDRVGADADVGPTSARAIFLGYSAQFSGQEVIRRPRTAD